ncbi:hypothetical protein LCGC14_1302180 [marine sediment metagenome]|uniref:Uncharacterized protein n=1 Tax=marine sediment metagenome TaxID=412755 RepID=A0A0F9KQL0_9ZZZZ
MAAWPNVLIRILKSVGGSEGVGDPILVNPRDFGSGKIINLADPIDNQDAATKKYVDDNDTDVQAIAKGWIKLNGTGTISIRDSFNVSGIVDNGNGAYTVTWDTDFANANYSAAGNASSGSRNMAIHTYAVGSVKILVRTTNTQVNTDDANVTLHAFGDQ